MRTLSRRRARAALGLAMVADGVQLGLLPLFAWGALSWPNDALDVVVAAMMIALLGWHWAFLPTLAAEMAPALDLFPTWTAAVLFVTRGTLWSGRELPEPVAAPAGSLRAGGEGEDEPGTPLTTKRR